MAIRAEDRCDVQCEHCKALHPLRQQVAHAFFCAQSLNSRRRPCPACGARGRWVVRLRREGADRGDTGTA